MAHINVNEEGEHMASRISVIKNMFIKPPLDICQKTYLLGGGQIWIGHVQELSHKMKGGPVGPPQVPGFTSFWNSITGIIIALDSMIVNKRRE